MHKAGVTLGKFIMDKEDLDHQASTHLSSTRGLLMRMGTRGTTPHRLGRTKEGSSMTWPTIQKISEDHDVLLKA
jgi:hypothetical protein